MPNARIGSRAGRQWPPKALVSSEAAAAHLSVRQVARHHRFPEQTGRRFEALAFLIRLTYQPESSVKITISDLHRLQSVNLAQDVIGHILYQRLFSEAQNRTVLRTSQFAG